jgi:hypothetical protein
MGPSTAEVGAIEVELERQRQGQWRCLNASELNHCPRGAAVAGWSINFFPGELKCAAITEVQLYLDALYPHSQPLVFAREAFKFTWPHVESDGLLCLPATVPGGHAAARIMQHLAWACELLNYSEEQTRQEFEREFGAYWAQRCTTGAREIISLLHPKGPSRRIAAWGLRNSDLIVVGESRADVDRWLRNSAKPPRSGRFQASWLTWQPRPWTPSEFPNNVAATLAGIPDSEIRELAGGHSTVPFVFGAQTGTGPVFAGMVADLSKAQNNLRPEIRSRPAPLYRVRSQLEGCRAARFKVARSDGAWVHGRDKDPDYPRLADKVVTVVGCGAIGGSIARLLAQSGVGNFLLVDPDRLGSFNTPRHVLGARYVGQGKAKGLAEALLHDFPHLHSVEPAHKTFETLDKSYLERVASSNLIVSAGIPYAADAAIDIWRRKAALRLTHVCTWAEEFALAGQAVALLGGDSLLELFNSEGHPHVSATDWPNEVVTTIVEAGCGNSFQPHGATDLLPIVAMAARMCLAILLGDIARSTHRMWLGDRERVFKLRGQVRDCFDRSFGEREI